MGWQEGGGRAGGGQGCSVVFNVGGDEGVPAHSGGGVRRRRTGPYMCVCVRVRGCVCVSAFVSVFVYVCTLGSGGSAIA